MALYGLSGSGRFKEKGPVRGYIGALQWCEKGGFSVLLPVMRLGPFNLLTGAFFIGPPSLTVLEVASSSPVRSNAVVKI